jgi:hypothetical protein
MHLEGQAMCEKVLKRFQIKWWQLVMQPLSLEVLGISLKKQLKMEIWKIVLRIS